MTWEQRERVLRLLMLRVNSAPSKYVASPQFSKSPLLLSSFWSIALPIAVHSLPLSLAFPTDPLRRAQHGMRQEHHSTLRCVICYIHIRSTLTHALSVPLS